MGIFDYAASADGRVEGSSSARQALEEFLKREYPKLDADRFYERRRTTTGVQFAIKDGGKIRMTVGATKYEGWVIGGETSCSSFLRNARNDSP